MYNRVFRAMLLVFSSSSTGFASGRETRGTVFERPTNVIAQGNALGENSTTAGSITECAVLCSEDERCMSFTFNKAQNMCRISKGRIVPASAEFGRSCPSSLGYVLLSYSSMALCLKYHGNGLSHTEARATCKAEGGHLALIESSTMRSLIPNVITDLNMRLTDTYFDGYDHGHNNTYYTWKGEPLPWLQWSPGEPDNRHSEDCIRIVLGDGEHSLRDGQCYFSNPFVCQRSIQ